MKKLALAAFLLVVIAATAAIAARPKTASTVSIHGDYDAKTSEFVYDGKVSSPKGVCRRGRTVRLYNTGGIGFLDEGKTKRDGSYELRLAADGLSGDYYVRAVRKATPTRICKGARSEAVPPPNARRAKPRVPSTVSLHTTTEGDEFVFRGRVRSEKHACEANRRVRITGGNFKGNEPVEEGTVKTGADGRYELRVMAAENSIGAYRAIALRKKRPNFICKVARSDIEFH